MKILVKYTNENCAGDDISRSTPLIYAAQMDHVEVVRVLLEGGANVERANLDQWTALHYAAMNGHLDMCRLLLDWGVNVNSLNKWKYTPLHYAAWAGHLSLVNCFWRGEQMLG
jgi:ankyrin repeat protein